VLIQNKQEVMRCAVDDVDRLEQLLTLFFAYERQEIADFRKSVEQFKVDLPAVLTSLREMIEQAFIDNAAFREASQAFLEHAREAINPGLTAADVREMLIQHVLTEEIFSKVFGEDDFHRQNNVAKELYRLEGTFFTGNLKKTTLRGLDAYYSAIRGAASQIGNHHEKQTFLKVIYENFYKVYNPKAADRLGVVYTPNEIVRFMIDSADWLCEKHFSKNLIDKDVEILDPATGTGTFICELLEHFRGQPAKLKHKYLEQLHANEVAILPYYVANLNIEATYAAIAGDYLEFPNLCFVDTLDNVGLHTQARGTTGDLFGSVSEENVARIRRQNSRKISVIIGNPPYRANQKNENENNKNREYPAIDARIKATYIKESTAQKTKLYDMYARFFLWASDRLDANGILAFVTNRSFVDKRTFDGFRKIVGNEFSEIYVIDLGGDVRANPKLSGTKHNVFGIQTGVAISFLVKRQKAQGCRIFYARRPELETAEEKLAFIGGNQLRDMSLEEIRPDAKHNWLNMAQNDFDSLLPIASKEVKAAKRPAHEKAIFKLFSNGINTARDGWVTDKSTENLADKLKFFLHRYDAHRQDEKKHDTAIKWSRNLKSKLTRGEREPFNQNQIVPYAYRPYFGNFLYQSELMIDELGQLPSMNRGENKLIAMPAAGDFRCLATNRACDFHFIGDSRVLSIYRYDENGTRNDNITDWALKQFKDHYQPGKGKKEQPITKEAIFHYVYAVLHDPLYREKYALNLKRDFPRIPLYADFWQWAAWGRELLELHIGYEAIEPYALSRVDLPDDGRIPKAMLKADKDAGRIMLDAQTTLSGVPTAAWTYKLGNRSALEWILDQYKESKPKDPTIREKFNTYRFADYKEKVVDLLARVTTVSMRTMAIVEAMKAAGR
jgi:predicted helicase